MAHLLPQYFRDFWWVLVVFILLLILIAGLYNKVKLKLKVTSLQNSNKQHVINLCLFIFILGISFLGIRGGLARAPIDIIDAGAYTSVEEIPLVLNTPFTIIKSLDKNELKEQNFYSLAELQSIYNPVHKFDSLTFRKKNIVVIILESFAKEYTGLGKTGVSYTPFLDSLTAQSFAFTNGFANGSKSIEGIPAILSGIPHLMENPFINSPYAGNFQTSFGTLLSKEGYTTAFFHGGINGTMNFDAYSKLAGYQHYFGRNEYNNDDDFDGFWGIWDEPFLQYSIKKMNEFKEPFHSSLFTLSSHHPYFVPEKYKGKFPKGTLENSESVGYSDYALKLFFNAAAKTKWFNNTLFVLCADHTSLSDHPFYRNSVGQQCIPILFFSPGSSLKGTYEKSFSQIDILPSVMNLLGYNKPFLALGQSYLNAKNHDCYYYLNGNVMMIADTIMASFNKNQISSVYNFKRDSSVSRNIKNKYSNLEATLDKEYRAFIQTYNS
ncbi:MAG: ltaS, partial [Bacteroidetes bacterium]|nr:ltaS [Bacteroidota bacterium]